MQGVKQKNTARELISWKYYYQIRPRKSYSLSDRDQKTRWGGFVRARDKASATRQAKTALSVYSRGEKFTAHLVSIEREAQKNSTSTEVRSPTSTETSTEAYTKDNVTVTGGAGAGATTKVTIVNRRNGKAGAVGNPHFNKSDLVNFLTVMLKLSKDQTTFIKTWLKEDLERYVNTELTYHSKDIKSLWNHSKRFQDILIHFRPDNRRYLTRGNSEKKLCINCGKEFTPTEKGQSACSVKCTREYVLRKGGRPKKNSTAADFRSHQKIRLQELAAMFQGEASGEKRRVAESDYTPSKKYRLGYLKLLKIKTPTGKIVPVHVNGDEKNIQAYVAADLRNNILIVGKDARFTDVKLPPKGQLKHLGKLIQIDYITAKKHIGGGKLIHFYHKLGEVTGEHPHIFMDSDGCPIIYGGGYDIWDVGIVN